MRRRRGERGRGEGLEDAALGISVFCALVVVQTPRAL